MFSPCKYTQNCEYVGFQDVRQHSIHPNVPVIVTQKLNFTFMHKQTVNPRQKKSLLTNYSQDFQQYTKQQEWQLHNETMVPAVYRQSETSPMCCLSDLRTHPPVLSGFLQFLVFQLPWPPPCPGPIYN